jgi:hypothetical protein
MATARKRKVDRAQRFPLKVPISCLQSGMLDWLEGKTVNISSSGVLFHTDRKLVPDATLSMKVQFSPRVTMICQGPIVREDKTSYAVQFNHCRILRSDGPAAQ